ncbi:hypothetical protein M2139_000173 [Enterococcus sp. PF1-24]|uniref:hypothetical protein n=1 Tax=unclassified Enterococcus TaxID=2608891 RepID=UPI002475A9F7|nr:MULTISPECIES: hypothetical protein [unclassified Enterococcus]MDH6363198.1 hypothetical protein [Enterococcus sp. PFB1-1]MDH6400292.1 hypothetical protein [Enterococcus sp. PF1-24]
MENQAPVITLKELKAKLVELEQVHQLTDDTKIFLDTGWDSVQEISPEAVSVESVLRFKIADPVSQDVFVGYSLKEKAKAVDKGETSEEQALIIRNLY